MEISRLHGVGSRVGAMERTDGRTGPAIRAAGDWHLRHAEEVARAHGVELHHGLRDGEAARRAERHGPNELTESNRRGPWRLLFDQFSDFTIMVLVGAAIVSGLIGDLVDTLAILMIVLLNGAIGFVQAWRAARAPAPLKRLPRRPPPGGPARGVVGAPPPRPPS